ncbi:MAG: phosphoribosyl-ATP diphosphatase [Planctomycetota bacterium]
MIIPCLTIDATFEADLDSIVQSIRNWSLFGQIAIRGIREHDLDLMEATFQQVGGSVDILMELDEDNETNSIRLLNAGATFVSAMPTATQAWSTIPADRVRAIVDDPSLDEAVPRGHVVGLTNPTSERIAELEMARIDVTVEIEALKNTEMIVDFLEQVLVTDREDGLWSTLIVDPMGVALGLAYSNRESLTYAIEHRVGTYYSRSRDELWIKGESSGATQSLLGLRFDCDRDCLRFRVTQAAPGFCHLKHYACFGPQRTIESVTQRLADRLNESDSKSFTKKLAADPNLLRTKLLEEAEELAEASEHQAAAEVTWEAADLFYFSLVAMIKNGVSVNDIHEELARRMNRVVRRKNKLESKEPS